MIVTFIEEEYISETAAALDGKAADFGEFTRIFEPMLQDVVFALFFSVTAVRFLPLFTNKKKCTESHSTAFYLCKTHIDDF